MAANRDKMGRFVKGHKVVGNRSGRPRRSTEEKYLASLLKVVTPSEWSEVIQKLLDKAKDGNLTAIRMILEYCVGKPTEYAQSDVDISAGGVDKAFREALERAYGDSE